MSATIPKAIETRYAGCHFRSRLEARWAVFFDALGIEWQYEPEGFELSWRLNLEPDTPLRYLPDFRLPGLDLWVEVKGRPTDDETIRLMNAAAALGQPQFGMGCASPNNTLVLGSLPRHRPGWPLDFVFTPNALHIHKGDLMVYQWTPGGSAACPNHCLSRGSDGPWWRSIGRDVGSDDAGIAEVGLTIEVVKRYMLTASPLWIGDVAQCNAYRRALDAARSARFEFGQAGPT